MVFNDFFNLFDARHKKGESKWNVEIVFADGKKEKMRLFWSVNGDICKFKKGSRKFGNSVLYFLKIDEVSSIRFVNDKDKTLNEKVSLMVKRTNKAIEYLTHSGLWSSLKSELEYFLKEVDVAEFCKDMESDFYHNVYLQTSAGGKYAWCAWSSVLHSLYFKGFKSINFDKWSRETNTQLLADRIANKTNYSCRWRNGYDNSIELNFNKEEARGWYSEEYKNCGNGHYYFLLDETHAIFAEDD